MEGVVAPTAAPRAVLKVRGHAVSTWVTCTLPGDQKQLSLGRAGWRGSLPGGALAPSPPHSSSALVPLLGTAAHLPWCLSLEPANACSSSFLPGFVYPALFYSLLFQFLMALLR